MDVIRLLAGSEQLHRAAAIAPDFGKEVERVARGRMEAILKTFPNGIGIREQIVEVDFDRPAFD
jgi:hypothetical protein